MPLYDFACTQCGHEYEALLKMDEPYDQLECPKCGAKGPKKLVTPFTTNSWSQFLDGIEKKIDPNKYK